MQVLLGLLLFFHSHSSTVRMFLSVTLLLEMQQKEFTSDKPIYPLQFGTIIHIMGLSLTFKTIK